jgi:hypothetical protein
VAEDAASFEFNKQSVKSWAIFFGLLSTVMGALYLVSLASKPVNHPRNHLIYHLQLLCTTIVAIRHAST